jgi:hypothetical protein
MKNVNWSSFGFGVVSTLLLVLPTVVILFHHIDNLYSIIR